MQTKSPAEKLEMIERFAPGRFAVLSEMINDATREIMREWLGDGEVPAATSEPTNDAMQMSAMPRTPGSSASCARSTIGGIA